MRRITIELTDHDAIDLEAAARYDQYGCRAEDAINRAIRRSIDEFRAERVRRMTMDNAEQELEMALKIFVRDDFKEYFAH